MFIDVVFLIIMVMAVFKGMSKGFIVAIFSLLAFIIGLAAALKLSAVVADNLRTSWQSDSAWLPFIAFMIIFVAVVVFIRIWATVLKKTVSLVFLGWADKLGGIILYVVMYLMAYSVILFFATKIHLISEEAQQASKTFWFIEPFGPKVMSGLGNLIPFFSDMFNDLGLFFERVSKKGP